MNIAAVPSAAVSAAPPSRANEEAHESSAERAREASQASAPVKGAPAPGTGTVVDLSA